MKISLSANQDQIPTKKRKKISSQYNKKFPTIKLQKYLETDYPENNKNKK
jgi:hypothetical protein